MQLTITNRYSPFPLKIMSVLKFLCYLSDLSHSCSWKAKRPICPPKRSFLKWQQNSWHWQKSAQAFVESSEYQQKIHAPRWTDAKKKWTLTCKVWLFHLCKVCLLRSDGPDGWLVVHGKSRAVEEFGWRPAEFLDQHHGGRHFREWHQTVGHLTGGHPKAVHVWFFVVAHQILKLKFQ